ncbi:MAG TPA: FAD-binding oxidoreductase [Candidatus Dormibacteraeota bacterium]|nr:FAD-binding oxidoreductase [Candidatus Dormibacteraeota bacterium]
MVTEPIVDGLIPRRLERPASAEELAEVLRSADEAGEAVIPVGGGRALDLGDSPERLDLVVETRGLCRVIEISQADLTASVEAGVTLEELDAELARVGQFVPLDPFNSPGHTVGGVLAAGLSGPLRLRYGPARDFVIGLRVALPEGRLVSSGGRVVKNVSGYDLNKLHLGALGTCGVIVAASFKLFPRPAHETTLEVHPEDPWGEAARALALPMPPIALELFGDGRLLARLAGTREGVTRMARELGWPEADPAIWTQHTTVGGDAVAWARISVPPVHLREVLERLPRGARWWASPGVGVAHWTGDLDPEAVTRARAAAEGVGGSLVLMRAPAALKRGVGAWGTPPPTLEWMRRLRDAFDPRRTLSPGRYVV